MAETLISPGISLSEVDMSTVPQRPLVTGAAIIGPTVKGRIKVPIKVTSYAEYRQIFGDVFNTTENGLPTTQEFLTSIAAKNYFEQGGESLLVTRIADNVAFQPAKSTTVEAVTGSVVPFALETLSPGVMMNNAPTGSWSGSYEREDGSLISGSVENIRWQILNVNNDNGTFTLVVRRGDDTDREQIVLESFNNVSLDPTSPNFISRVIGDQEEKFVSGSVQVVSGNYPNKSNFVRVSSVNPLLNYLDTDGNVRSVGGVSLSGSLPKEQSGGFWSGSGIVGMCYSSSHEALPSTEAKYFENLGTGATDYNQAVTLADYSDAIAVLSDSDEYQFNVISAPGLLDADTAGALVQMAENRTDCIAVVDLNAKNTEVQQVISKITDADINSSYGATYWPWVQMVSATGRYVWCPASTVIPGVYTYTDHQTAPWYAPAGMSRGGVYGVIQTSRKLTRADRDKLYAKNINPIATLPGAGIVVYGQKTLQKKASALDRINVRRMLIEVKDTIRKMAAGLLFEQNTTALQNQFKTQVDPYLASIVQRKGLVAYKIDTSENDNPDVVDRNEFRASIQLIPTKVTEFIYLTFTVTATGVSFD